MNNYTQFNAENRGRGRGGSDTFNGRQAVGRGDGFGRSATGNAGRGRGNIRGGTQTHTNTTQSRPLDNRSVVSVDANVTPKGLTGFFKQCRTLEELNNLYYGQKDKPYFDYIHACASFSQAIKLFTQKEGYKNITKPQLMVFIEIVFSYREDFDARALANVANDAVKFMDYAQKMNFKGGQEAVNLACATLGRVFEEVVKRKNLEGFKPQELANVANDAVKLMDYAQNRNFKGGEELVNLACATLRCVFEEVVKRKNLEDFNAQNLANIANDAVKLIEYAQNRNFKGGEALVNLACATLGRVFEEVVKRKNLEDFTPQSLANLANDAAKLIEYAQNRNFKGGEELVNLACATLGRVFEEVAKRNLENFNSQDLANIANDAVKLMEYAKNRNFKGGEETVNLAFVTLGCIFEEVTKRNLEDFTPQSLANIANDAVKLVDYILNRNFGDGKKIVNLACATLGCVFGEVEKRKNLEDFTPQGLANIANGLVKARYWNNETSKLLIKIGKNVCERDFNIFDVQSIGNLAWSFSMGGQLPLICDWLINGLSTLDNQQLSELVMENAGQLYITFLRKALDEKKWNKEDPDAFLKSYLNQELAKIVLKKMLEESSNIKISKFQHNVGVNLKKILPESYFLNEEYYIKPYPVDFAIFKGKGENVKFIAIVEANGPTHFMLNGKYDLIHKFKEGIIYDMGYKEIINIDYIEWDNSENKEGLLKEKLFKVIEESNKQESVSDEEEKIEEEKIIENIPSSKPEMNLAEASPEVEDTKVNDISRENSVEEKNEGEESLSQGDGAEVLSELQIHILGEVSFSKDLEKIMVDEKPKAETTIMDSIIYYATSFPAIALYLILLAISFNSIRYKWNLVNSTDL